MKKNTSPLFKPTENREIHWINNPDGSYAGIHLLAEFWECKPIDDPKQVKQILNGAALAANTKPLEIAVHKFDPHGITGFVILEESHCSIHTWPEEKYIAVDVFTCGDDSMPEKAVEYLRKHFQPQRVDIQRMKRGEKKVPEKTTEAWFFEKEVPGINKNIITGIKYKDVLFSKKSVYQDVQILDTVSFGKMLVLDGIVQTTEKDEFIYHENMIHIPMLYHPNPKKVLVVGGGDGGALEEILKYPVESAHMVEIDGLVVEACKKYIPSICKNAFLDPRTNVIIGDGKDFIHKHKNYFDVIVLDLSDPFGPAEDLISEEFYKNVHDALTENGVISIQSGSLEFQTKETALINKRIKKIFKSSKIHKAVIPTYQSCEFSTTIASKQNLNKITLEEIEKRFEKFNLKDLKYYTPKLHFSSAVLPKYISDALKN